MQLKQFFIGRSPLTTIAGYIVAIATGIAQAHPGGMPRWQELILPAAIALFGRIAGDDKRKDPPAAPAVPEPVPTPPTAPDRGFLRRGREHRQGRHRNGRFAALAVTG